MLRVVLVLLALVFATSAAAATRAGHPRVALVDRSPATVVGRSFRPAERVAVTVSTGGLVLRKSVYAVATGSFTARWRRALPNGCSSLTITAVGSAGSRASYKLAPPECAPPISP